MWLWPALSPHCGVNSGPGRPHVVQRGYDLADGFALGVFVGAGEGGECQKDLQCAFQPRQYRVAGLLSL